MKKNNLLKTVLLFLFAVFLLQGCRSEENALEKSNPNTEYKIIHQNYSLVQKNNNLNQKFTVLENIATTNKKNSEKQNSENIIEIDGIKIFKNSVTYVSPIGSSKETYSFYVENSNVNLGANSVQNLVFSKKENETDYSAYLVTYTFPEGINSNNKNFKISKIEKLNISSLFSKKSNTLNTKLTAKTSSNCPETYSYEIIEIKHKCYSGKDEGASEAVNCDKKGSPPYSTYVIKITTMTADCGTESWGTPESGSSAPGGGSGSASGSTAPSVDTSISLPPTCQTGDCNEEILANKINTSLEMPLDYYELLWLNSNTDFAEGIWNMLSNNSSTETKNFAQWGITFASNNNISWTQFQNWFVEGDQDFNRDLLKMIVENNHKIPQYTSSDFPGMNNGMPYNWWNDENYLNNMSLGFNNINLTKEEKKMCALFPLAAVMIFSNKDIALNEASSTFPNQIPHNNKADAFRHAFFNALNTRDVYSQFSTRGTFTFAKNIVRMFGIAHESEVPQELLLEKAMDLYNNEGGIEVCSTCNPLTNPTNLVKGYVLSLLNEGKLVHIWPLNNDQTIRPDSNIYPTNQH